MPEKTSKLSGFYKLTPEERQKTVREFADLTDEDISVINSGMELPQANRMIENVIGMISLPIGIATNFLIDGKDYLVPMALEEPSVVAAASNMARIARVRGGFHASSDEPVMIGQIQIVDVSNAETIRQNILSRKQEIIDKANEQDSMLIKFGGGTKDIEIRTLETDEGTMVIVHLLVDCRDAMGANAVNTMAEAVTPIIEECSSGNGRILLRIISNLAIHRIARAQAVFDRDMLGGEHVVDDIVKAYAFACADPYRCATYNKGIMNGIDAVILATGNDFRAVEAGAHAYAALSGYKPLVSWKKNSDGDLQGNIELPIAAGIIGGATSSNPAAKVSLKILGAKTARELAEVMVSVGLAQNLGALRALATEGIQRGHMSLHARNIAIMAGAEGEMIDKVAGIMAEERMVRPERAKEILEELRGG
ncbi:MAG TPA: hydroxymethylglutaryl-CoA reductase, degradative [Methanosarcinales archaeon]|nr:hydroxymethylglutaryl-CoA reductase, degradative [Methanosarcinales archaeon]